MSKKYCLLKEELMNYIPEEIIDGILERMKNELKLPRAYIHRTKYPSTPEEVSTTSFEDSHLEAWKGRFTSWLGEGCTHEKFVLMEGGKLAICQDCGKEFRPDMQEVKD